jgi:hypothetical protein
VHAARHFIWRHHARSGFLSKQKQARGCGLRRPSTHRQTAKNQANTSARNKNGSSLPRRSGCTRHLGGPPDARRRSGRLPAPRGRPCTPPSESPAAPPASPITNKTHEITRARATRAPRRPRDTWAGQQLAAACFLAPPLLAQPPLLLKFQGLSILVNHCAQQVAFGTPVTGDVAPRSTGSSSRGGGEGVGVLGFLRERASTGNSCVGAPPFAAEDGPFSAGASGRSHVSQAEAAKPSRGA